MASHLDGSMAFVLLNLASGLSLYNISKEAHFQYTNRIKLLPCSKSFRIFPFLLGYRRHFFALIQSSKPICPCLSSSRSRLPCSLFRSRSGLSSPFCHCITFAHAAPSAWSGPSLPCGSRQLLLTHLFPQRMFSHRPKPCQIHDYKPSEHKASL